MVDFHLLKINSKWPELVWYIIISRAAHVNVDLAFVSMYIRMCSMVVCVCVDCRCVDVSHSQAAWVGPARCFRLSRNVLKADRAKKVRRMWLSVPASASSQTRNTRRTLFPSLHSIVANLCVVRATSSLNSCNLNLYRSQSNRLGLYIN